MAGAGATRSAGRLLKGMARRSFARRNVMLGLLGLAAAGVGARAETPKSRLAPATESVVEAGPVRVGEPLPTFAAFDTQGALVRLRDLLRPPRQPRADVVIVSFFATWCEPCRESLPALVGAARGGTGRTVRAALIASGEDREKVVPFLDRLGLALPTLLDPYGKVSERMGVKTLPRTFVIDGDGIVRGIFVKEGKDFATRLKDMLDAVPPPSPG